jgi:hypothetical protein
VLEKYEPHRPGIRDLLTLPGLDAVLMAEAERVAAKARANAPVDSGEYRASIVARVVSGRTQRRAAEVAATAPHAAAVEARTRPLGRAIGGRR